MMIASNSIEPCAAAGQNRNGSKKYQLFSTNIFIIRQGIITLEITRASDEQVEADGIMSSTYCCA